MMAGSHFSIRLKRGKGQIALLVSSFVLACAIVILRRPDAVFHAQFFAEDGSIWYATAYNYGWWRVLFSPYQGYIHLAPRLAAAFALAVPFTYAPLIENLGAIGIQALPASLLMSQRSSNWGPLCFRVLLALLYLILPNTREMMSTITEAQWYLALSTLIIIVAQPPESNRERIFNISLITLCSLTGPFCLFLLPFAVYKSFRHGFSFWNKSVLAVLSAGCSAQIASLVLHVGSRLHPTLGVDLRVLAQILSGQVFMGTVIGSNSIGPLMPTWAILGIAAFGSLTLIRCFRTTGTEMRSFVIFSGIVLAASLVSPTAYPPKGMTAWQELAYVSGIRYWFLPCLTFIWAILYGVCSSDRSFRIAASCLLIMMPVGLLRDFRYSPLIDCHFSNSAERFDAASPGSLVVISTLPQNRGWQMVLVKH